VTAKVQTEPGAKHPAPQVVVALSIVKFDGVAAMLVMVSGVEPSFSNWKVCAGALAPVAVENSSGAVCVRSNRSMPLPVVSRLPSGRSVTPQQSPDADSHGLRATHHGVWRKAKNRRAAAGDIDYARRIYSNPCGLP
jgi:hypothetical protein